MFQGIWFYGRIENVLDPIETGRAQVRIRGVHEMDKTILPDEFLPWATIMTPATSAGDPGGIGRSPTGLQKGSEVLGISLDDSYTDLRILFTWAATRGSVSDIHPLALGKAFSVTSAIEESRLKDVDISKSNKIEEPSMDRSSVYPMNDVNMSRAGFVTEDDSSNGARNSAIHPSGFYREWRTDGGFVTRMKYMFKFVRETLFQVVGGSWINRVAGNVVNKFASDFYQSVTGQSTIVSPKALYSHSEGMEVDAPALRLSGDLRGKGVLYFPEIRVGTLYADNINCSGLMKGTAAFANQAGVAGGIGTVTPVTGEAPGDLAFDLLFSDNGGDYPASQTVTGGKTLPLSYEINRPPAAQIDKQWNSAGLDKVEKVDSAVAGKMFTDSLKFGPEGAWQCVQRALNAMNDKRTWPILEVNGEQNDQTVQALDKAVKRRGQAHVLNCISIARFAFILELIESDPSKQPEFKTLVEDENFLKLPSDPDAQEPTV